MNAPVSTRRLPLSRHSAFTPLVSLWLAALVGGCIAVWPGQFALQPDVIVGCAALGGLSGWIAARIVAGVQDRPGRLRAKRPGAYVERLLVGIDLADREQDHPTELAPQPEPRHGKAVQLLRQRLPQDLAMPLLVERFAIALDDHRAAACGHSPEAPRPAPPAELGFALYALRNQFRRATHAHADSSLATPGLALSGERAARE